MRVSVACLVIFGLAFTEQRSYDSYKVYRVTPKSMDEAKVLKEFENNENVDFWTDLRMLNAPVDIMVSPIGQSTFEDALQTHKLDYEILINNVEETVQEERNRLRNSPRLARGEVTFNEYMRYDDIVAYLEQLALLYPTTVTTEVLGRSFEGRNVIAVKISSGGANKTQIFAEAAIHAREWIAPPVALYVVHQLVENPENAHMYQDIDWTIIPVANPDGYEYTHTEERLWRKTRTPGTICHGIDPNRNFDANWLVIGASSWQCANNYAGHVTFSEPETRIIRDYTLANKDNIELYLAIHSQGQWLLYPWGHTTDEPVNSEELNVLGNLFRDAIFDVNGTVYNVGSTANLLYYAAGTSVDWAYGGAGIDLGYTIELPGGGSYGWDLPPDRIDPVVKETWEGIKALHGYIQEKFGNARFWRKTRSFGTVCDGTDGNRNFNYYWNVIGASSWQCDETYAGYTPFSEIEAQIIRDYTLANKDNIKLFLSIHSYGNWFLHPWGHINDLPENSEQLTYLGELFRDAIFAVDGTSYTIGSTANLLYFAAGTTIDWAKAVAGIDLTYTIELPAGPGGGLNGFAPPPERIVPIVEETWEGFKALHDYIKDTYVNSS